jgi:hypothetical protein
MPRSAWVEIRDQAGGLVASIPARIAGGSVTAELPPFPPTMQGTIQLCTDEEGRICRDPAELRELPTVPGFMVVNIG